MAEQYNYTSSTGIVTPNSQPLKASPARTAFDSVNNLISSASKGAVAYVNQQTLNLQATLSATTQEKALVDTQSVIDGRSNAAIYNREYQESMVAAGENVEGQAKATDQYQRSLQGLLQGQNPTVTSSLQETVLSGVTKSDGYLLKSLNIREKQDLVNAVSLTIPSLADQSPEEQKAAYDEMLSLGASKGLTAEYMGNLITSGRINHAIGSVNVEELVNSDTAYEQIADLTLEVEQNKALNPYNTEAYDKANAKIAQVKNLADAGVRADVLSARTILNKEMHEENLIYGESNGVFTPTQAIMERVKFSQSRNSSGRLNQEEASRLYGVTGFANPSDASDPKVKSLLVAQAIEDSRKAIGTDPERAKKYAEIAQKQYEPVYNEWRSEAVNSVIQLALDNRTTPEELRAAVAKTGTLMSEYSFNVSSTAQKNEWDMIQAVVKVGDPSKLDVYMKNIQDGDVTPFPVTNKGVESLIKGMPTADRRQAIATYSALVKSGALKESEASAYVLKTMEPLDTKSGNTLSHSLAQDLEGAGNTPADLKVLDAYLPTTLTGDVKATYDEFMSRTGSGFSTGQPVEYSLEGDWLRITSGDNNLDIAMPPAERNSFSAGLANYYQKNQKDSQFGKDALILRDNVGAGVEHVASAAHDIYTSFSSAVGEFAEEFFVDEGRVKAHGNFFYELSEKEHASQKKQLAKLDQNLKEGGIASVTSLPIAAGQLYDSMADYGNKLHTYFTGADEVTYAAGSPTEKMRARLDEVLSKFREESVTDGESFGEVVKTLQKVEVPAEAPSPEKSSASSIAERLGLPEGHVKTLIKLESGNASYVAVNPVTLATGKFQFMTTGEVGEVNGSGLAYARKEGYTGEKGAPLREWMQKNPKAQDEMFIKFTADNLAGLKRRGIANPTAFHLYGSHQQGLKGFMEILSGKVNDARAINIKANLNGTGQDLEGKELADYWIKFWKAKIS